MAGSIVGSIFNYTSECLYTLQGDIGLTPAVVMKSIVDSNREVLKDPVGTRIVRRLARSVFDISSSSFFYPVERLDRSAIQLQLRCVHLYPVFHALDSQILTDKPPQWPWE